MTLHAIEIWRLGSGHGPGPSRFSRTSGVSDLTGSAPAGRFPRVRRRPLSSPTLPDYQQERRLAALLLDDGGGTDEPGCWFHKEGNTCVVGKRSRAMA
jgi:hypothetical protein